MYARVFANVCRLPCNLNLEATLAKAMKFGGYKTRPQDNFLYQHSLVYISFDNIYRCVALVDASSRLSCALLEPSKNESSLDGS